MAAQLKLHYFNGRGRAELIRFVLAYAKVEYEDYRIEIADWPKLKPTYPNQQVPALEITNEDGKHLMLSQSLAIARFLAKQHGLAGADFIEEARCDEIADTLAEVHNFGAMSLREEDPVRKQQNMDRLRTVEIPRVFGRIEKQLLLNGGEYIVGEKYTWVDFYAAVLLGGMIKRLGPDAEKFVRENFPGMFGLQQNVESVPEIAAYIAKRPDTPF